MKRSKWHRTLLLAFLCSLCLTNTSVASDWIHWRGPEMTGQAREPSLPDTFDLTEVGKGNLDSAGLERLLTPPARCGATAPACGLFLMSVEY